MALTEAAWTWVVGAEGPVSEAETGWGPGTGGEWNHNLVGGCPPPRFARCALGVLRRRGGRDNPRHTLRFDITSDLLDRAGIVHRTLAFPGQSMLSEVLQLAYFTDYVSYYLALLNGADPSEVKSIDYLKDQLAKR